MTLPTDDDPIAGSGSSAPPPVPSSSAPSHAPHELPSPSLPGPLPRPASSASASSSTYASASTSPVGSTFLALVDVPPSLDPPRSPPPMDRKSYASGVRQNTLEALRSQAMSSSSGSSSSSSRSPDQELALPPTSLPPAPTAAVTGLVRFAPSASTSSSSSSGSFVPGSPGGKGRGAKSPGTGARQVVAGNRSPGGGPRKLTLEHSLRILIVDDNALNLRVLRQILLKSLAHLLDASALRTASSGPEALTLLSTTDFDLVLLDISMAPMSGLEVCRRLRDGLGPGEEWLEKEGDVEAKRAAEECKAKGGELRVTEHNRGIDVCAVTTDLADWQVEMYRRAGFNGCVGKPLKEPDLAYALQLAIVTSFPFAFPSPAFSTSSNDSEASGSSRTSGSGGGNVVINSGRPTYPFYFRRHGQEQVLPPLAAAFPPPKSPASDRGSAGSSRRSSKRRALGGLSGRGSPAFRNRQDILVEDEVNVGGPRRRSAISIAQPERTDSSESNVTIVPRRASVDSKRTDNSSGPSAPSSTGTSSRPSMNRGQSFESQTTDGSSAPSSLETPEGTQEGAIVSVGEAGRGVVSPEELAGQTESMLKLDLGSKSASPRPDPLARVVSLERNPFDATFQSLVSSADVDSWRDRLEPGAITVVADGALDPLEGEEPDELMLDDVADDDSTPSPKLQVVEIMEAEERRMHNAWTALADPTPTAPEVSSRPPSTDPFFAAFRPAARPQSGPSNAMRHLLARRSQPFLSDWRAYSFDETMSVGRKGNVWSGASSSSSQGDAMAFELTGRRRGARRRMSEAGDPPRPTWQLVALGKEQSVLKEGPLLNEVLEGLDKEDKMAQDAA